MFDLMLAVKVSNSTVVVEECVHPECKDGDVLVKMRTCGLCGSDLEKVYGKYSMSSGRVGHEPAGEVIEVGNKVKRIAKGDRVFVHHHVSCYSCWYCTHGDYTMCEMYQKSNIEPCGLSQEFLVPKWNVNRGGLLHLPDNISYDEAALIEPLACCIRAFNKSGIRHGDNVAIIGAGPTGVMHMLLSENAGANHLFVIDINDYRLKFTESYQNTFTFNPNTASNIVERIKELSHGIGADLTIIATGNPLAVDQALSLTRRGGKILLFGVPPKDSMLKLDLSLIYSNELNVTSSYGCSEIETNQALSLISQKSIDVKPLITHRFRIEQSAEAFRCAKDANGVMKVIITS
jgi:L-iditol 2-dehydrogenase